MHMLYLVFKCEFFFFQATRCFRHLSRLMTKPTKWHMRPAKTDQTGRIRLGIRPVWPSLRCPHEASLHWVHSEDSDQAGRMPMLIWVFTGRTDHFVGGSFYVGHQSYQINHIPCSKKKEQYPKKYPLYVPFSAGTVCRTSPNSSKSKNCIEPEAMSPGDV